MGRRTFYICACVTLSSKVTVWPYETALCFGETARIGVVNTTGRFAELATNVKQYSSSNNIRESVDSLCRDETDAPTA